MSLTETRSCPFCSASENIYSVYRDGGSTLYHAGCKVEPGQRWKNPDWNRPHAWIYYAVAAKDLGPGAKYMVTRIYFFREVKRRLKLLQIARAETDPYPQSLSVGGSHGLWQITSTRLSRLE